MRDDGIAMAILWSVGTTVSFSRGAISAAVWARLKKSLLVLHTAWPLGSHGTQPPQVHPSDVGSFSSFSDKNLGGG